MLVRWELQGEPGGVEVVQERLRQLEPGFAGRLAFTFEGAVGLRMAVPLPDLAPALLVRLANRQVLSLAERLGERFSFPCSDRAYEERDLTLPSKAALDSLESALAGTGLASLGGAFCRAEREVGVNGVALAALAAWQSAWGGSHLARERCNLFGWGAAQPGGAERYASTPDCVAKVSRHLACDYLRPGGRHFHGPNLLGLGVRYATDPDWAHGVAAVWQGLEERIARQARGQ